ncbi:MAG: ABC transporter permease [Acidobacteriota bacterium]
MSRLFPDHDLGVAWAVFMRNATEYRRTWKSNILPNFFEPVLYLVGMGVGLGAYISGGLEGKTYLAFIAPGLVASSAMNGATFESTYNMFVKMTFARLYDAYLATPAQVEDVCLGELMWAVARSLIYGLAFLIVVLGMGLFIDPLITSPWALLMPLAIVLIGVTFALIGQLYTSIIKKIDHYSYYFTLFLTPLFLFSGIFFPVSRFPHGETIAWFTPLHHAVRLSRGLCQGPLGPEQGVSALWLLSLSAILALVVPNRLRKRFFQ